MNLVPLHENLFKRLPIEDYPEDITNLLESRIKGKSKKELVERFHHLNFKDSNDRMLTTELEFLYLLDLYQELLDENQAREKENGSQGAIGE